MKQKLHPLCVALLALVLCNTPLLAEEFAVDGIYYDSMSDKTVAITYRGDWYYDYPDEYSGAVTIPESVTYRGNTYSVTSIGNSAFRGCTGLTSVEIPNSVTTIGECAFRGCSSLTSVKIPNSVTSIASSTFRGCSSLTSVVIPNSVTSIGDEAFYDCSSLTSVVIPNSVTSIEVDAFYGTAWYKNQPDGVMYMDNYLLGYKGTMPSNTSIKVKDGTLLIANSAFADCSSLTSVVIPNSVTSIGDKVFYRCTNLTSVEIPNSVTSIGDGVFSGCDNLTSVEIPNSVTSIASSTFWGCSSLISVEIPNSVTSIGKDAFSGTAWYNNQPDGVVYLDTYLLHYKGTMPSNTSIEIKDGTLLIADCAFQECHSLTSVEIPNSVIRIGVYAFDECSSLTSVVIPNSVTYIGWAAFYGCDRLKTATVGCSWITKPLYFFNDNVTVNATLHSYENGVCTVCGEKETTGIDEITSNAHQRSATFDLQGSRVNNACKGLYIVNGKKVIMK